MAANHLWCVCVRALDIAEFVDVGLKVESSDVEEWTIKRS